jgi:sortase A
MGNRAFRKFSKQRRRPVLLALIGLVILIIGGFVFFGIDSVLQSNESSVEQVEETPEGASEEKSEEEQASEEEQEEPAPIVPDDTTLYLSVPKLGIYDALVLDSEAGLELGGQLIDGYPWQRGDTNTYIAGHRIGFPGTGSDHILYNLPLLEQGDEIFLQDSLDRMYEYRVSEVFAVTPYDVWAVDPVAGRNIVTLQTCTETPSDWWTVGPRLMSSGPESGRLVVRADQV